MSRHPSPVQTARRETMRRIRLRAHMAEARTDAMTTGREVTVAEVAQRARRRARYLLRDVGASLTGRDRLAACGRKRCAPVVSLKIGQRGAGYAGVETCASIWACSVCAAAIRNHRAQEIQLGVSRHVAAAGGGMFITLTVPHGKRDPLRETLGTVTKGWGKIMNTKRGREYRTRLGIIGYIRAVEVTDGDAGWHPHLHLLVLTETPLGEDTMDDFAGWLRAAWVAYARDRDWGRTGGKFGCDVQDIVAGDGLATYVAKVQDGDGIDRVLGAELARADMKAGRGGRTPFEMLADVAVMRAEGTDPDGRRERTIAARWREYETETKGLSALRWSNGLRGRLGVEEITDAQIIETQDLVDAQTIVTIRPVDWLVICRQGQRGALLDAAERGGRAAALALIEQVLLRDLEEWALAVDLALGEPVPV